MESPISDVHGTKGSDNEALDSPTRLGCTGFIKLQPFPPSPLGGSAFWRDVISPGLLASELESYIRSHLTPSPFI